MCLRLDRFVYLAFLTGLLASLMLHITRLNAQTVEPLIAEYTTKADGRFEVRNDTSTPMAVVLDTRSFNVSSEGRGVYRPLDKGIVLKISVTSMRLAPGESTYVFYKASAVKLPAWFQVQAAFTPLQRRRGIMLRVVLPHTVYLYQKSPVEKDAIQISTPRYKSDVNTIVCELENHGQGLVRVQEIRAIAGKESAETAGFPLLPGAIRKLSIEWKSKKQPELLVFQFPQFAMREPLVGPDQ
jgi:hypothetical protein